VFHIQILRSALLKITTLASFPRKACPELAEGRESTDVGPRFRRGDGGADFHSLGWAGAHGYSVEGHVIPAKAGIQLPLS
jgi:hypothetical protein